VFRVEPYQPADLPAVKAFVAAIQEHERALVPELKPGAAIGAAYAALLLRRVAERDGAILMARAGDETVGFVCAWVERDDDPLLGDEARVHAYVSDLFVIAARRRQGIARILLAAIERELRQRGCRRIRIVSKASNIDALACYDAAGYRPYETILSKALD